MTGSAAECRTIAAMPAKRQSTHSRKITLQTQLATFLTHLSKTAHVTASAAAAGLDRAWIYGYKKQDPEFSAAWDEAIELGNEFLEDTAIKRATTGVERDVYYQGEVVGQESVFSDALLMFMLKARRPERFKERTAADINAKVTGAVVVQTAGPSDEAL